MGLDTFIFINGIIMNSKPLWFFFISSVWLFMGYLLYNGVWDIINYAEVLSENPAAAATGKSAQFIFGTIVLFGMEFTFWYKFFRYPTDGARVFAAFMGIAMLLVIFAGYVVADLLASEKNDLILWFYWYVALGHISFALFGKDKRETESTFIFYK